MEGRVLKSDTFQCLAAMEAWSLRFVNEIWVVLHEVERNTYIHMHSFIYIHTRIYIHTHALHKFIYIHMHYICIRIGECT